MSTNLREYTFTDGQHLAVGTMFCIGRNYAAHAKEMNAEVPSDPLVFLKPPQSYLPDNSTLVLPSFSANVHHEVELVVVIGNDVDTCTVDTALQYVAGYAVGIDCTLRDLQSKAKERGEPWTLSKAFRGSAPISHVVPSQQIPVPEDVEIELLINGQPRQYGKVRMMERSVAELIVYLSSVFGLRRGDCIFTGTPEGVAQLKTGDVGHASIKNIIDLVFTVA